MANIKTQKEMVLEHLINYGSLDTFTAFREYGIFTGLRSRVAELRKEGHNIKTGWISGKSKITGRIWRIANYKYIKQVSI